MIVYRVELWCDGCHREVFHVRIPATYMSIPSSSEKVVRQSESEGWLTDAGEHFCPKCQIQRRGVAQQADAEQTLQKLKSIQ